VGNTLLEFDTRSNERGGIFGPDESGNHFLVTGNGYLFGTGDTELVTTFGKMISK
jgi:hypothetical protein